MSTENENKTTTDNTIASEAENIQSHKDPTATVPLSEFLKRKEQNKALEAELAEYRKADSTRAEQKLLEEKNFQEVINQKNEAIRLAELKLQDESKRANVERLNNKALAALHKHDIIDGEDGLRLFGIENFLGDEGEARLIESVAGLKTNKPYLFKSGVVRTPNDGRENGTPASIGGQKEKAVFQPRSIQDKLVGSLLSTRG